MSKKPASKSKSYKVSSTGRLLHVGAVAACMDEWTREENTAYAKVLAFKNKVIESQKREIMRLQSKNSRYINRLEECSSVIQDDNVIFHDLDVEREWVPEIHLDDDDVPFIVNMDQ